MWKYQSKKQLALRLCLWITILFVSSEGSRQSRGAGESPSGVSTGHPCLWGLAGTGTGESWLLHPAGGGCWYAGGDSPKAAGLKIISMLMLVAINIKYYYCTTSNPKKPKCYFTQLIYYLKVYRGNSAHPHLCNCRNSSCTAQRARLCWTQYWSVENWWFPWGCLK